MGDQCSVFQPSWQQDICARSFSSSCANESCEWDLVSDHRLSGSVAIHCNGTDPLRDCYNMHCVAHGTTVASYEPLTQSLRCVDGAYVSYADSVEKLAECEQPLRRTVALDDWLIDAIAGRAITLVMPCSASENTTCTMCKVSSMRYLNLSLTALIINPLEATDLPSFTITLDNVQSICSFAESTPLWCKFDSVLDEGERARAVLLLHIVEGAKSDHLCFLEDSEHSKNRFIHELREIWIEKRL